MCWALLELGEWISPLRMRRWIRRCLNLIHSSYGSFDCWLQKFWWSLCGLGYRMLEQALKRHSRVSIRGDTQSLTGHGPRQPSLTSSALSSGNGTKWSPQLLSNLNSTLVVWIWSTLPFPCFPPRNAELRVLVQPGWYAKRRYGEEFLMIFPGRKNDITTGNSEQHLESVQLSTSACLAEESPWWFTRVFRAFCSSF